MKVVKAAAVQLSPVVYSREGTVEKVVLKISYLAARGCSAQQKTKPMFYGAEQGFTEDIEGRTR